MNDEEKPHEPAEVEILPPEQAMPTLGSTNYGGLTFSLVERIRLWGITRVVDSLRTLYEAEGLAHEAATRRNNSVVEYEESLVSLEKLGPIVERERRRIHAEIQKGDLRDAAEIASLKEDKEQAKFERRKAKNDHKISMIRSDLAVENASSPREERGELGKHLDKITQSSKYLKELEELRDRFLKEAGVEKEDDLDDVQTAILRRAREAVETYGS